MGAIFSRGAEVPQVVVYEGGLRLPVGSLQNFPEGPGMLVSQGGGPALISCAFLMSRGVRTLAFFELCS